MVRILRALSVKALASTPCELSPDVASATASGYAFDDIGNRDSAAERGIASTCAANSINPYTNILRGAVSLRFISAFDLAGNCAAWIRTGRVHVSGPGTLLLESMNNFLLPVVQSTDVRK